MYFSKSHNYSDGNKDLNPDILTPRIYSLVLLVYENSLRRFPNTEICLIANSLFEEWSKKYW